MVSNYYNNCQKCTCKVCFKVFHLKGKPKDWIVDPKGKLSTV